MKRKTFIGLLFRNLAISIVATILVLVLSGTVALKIALLTFEKNFVNEQNHLIEYYQSRYLSLKKQNPTASNDEILNEAYNFIRCELVARFKYVPLDVVLFSSSALYDQDTGELIYDSREMGYIYIVNNETGDEDVLFCHETKLDKLKEVIGNNRHLALDDAVVWDYYIKDGKKYFGRVEFYEDSWQYGAKEFVDFAPELPGVYEYIQVNIPEYRISGPQYWGYETTDDEIVELQKYVEDGYWFYNTKDNFKYELNGLTITGMGTQTFRMPDGTSLRIFDRANVDLYECYKKWIISICIIVPVVAIVIGILAAYIKYTKLRAMYTMDDYRRTLTDSMAHDLKSPLMAISGYAENLRENVNTEKKDHYAESIINNVQYMNDIISNILQLSKLDSGTIKLNNEKLELGKLIKNNLEKYEEIISENNLEVRIENSAKVRGDANLLSQAFDNLLSNAMKYSEPDSTVEIVLEDNIMTGVKRVVISNLCNTQPEVEATDLWKPFVKGDNSRSNKKGTGIGLTISKNIFEMHGFKQKLSYNDGKFIVEIQLN